MNKNYLLLCMLFFYGIIIYYIYFYYSQNKSVSSIICDNNHKYNLLLLLGLVGTGGILYELERKDNISIGLITSLVILLLSLICIPETTFIHYIFAGFICLIILFFMIRQIFIQNFCKILSISLCLEFLLLFIIIEDIQKNIFYSEVIYILNFAFYYIYLHMLS